MRTSIMFGLVLAAAFAVGIGKADAAVYLDGRGDPYIRGGCTYVSTRAEADATHVYTLNPDYLVYHIARSYSEYWGRGPSCSELQFHVDHNTTEVRLRAWLGEVATGWYRNIGNTHFEGKTVSTSRHEWFLVQNGVVRRIPDWLTALSWGLLLDDRLSIPAGLTEAFYDNVTIGAPLSFSQGRYAGPITKFWKTGTRPYWKIPLALRTEIKAMLKRGTYSEPFRFQVFKECGYEFASSGDPYGALLDWSWMLRNPGCALEGQ